MNESLIAVIGDGFLLRIISILWVILAISSSVFFTVVSVFALAWILIVGGIIRGVQASDTATRALFLTILESAAPRSSQRAAAAESAARRWWITLLLSAYCRRHRNPANRRSADEEIARLGCWTSR